jgi:hypothetical protein
VGKWDESGFATHVKHLAVMQRDMLSEAMFLSVPRNRNDRRHTAGKIDDRRSFNDYRRGVMRRLCARPQGNDENKEGAAQIASGAVHAPKFWRWRPPIRRASWLKAADLPVARNAAPMRCCRFSRMTEARLATR